MSTYIGKSQISHDLRRAMKQGYAEEVLYQLEPGDTAFDPENFVRIKINAPSTLVYRFSEQTGNIILISND